MIDRQTDRQFFLKEEFQTINKKLQVQLLANDCYRQDLMIADKISELKFEEKQGICTISKYTIQNIY